MKSVRFRRVITGYRCHEDGCYSTAVWYIETESEFFHWCPKHAVAHMRDDRFWRSRVKIPGATKAQIGRPPTSRRGPAS